MSRARMITVPAVFSGRPRMVRVRAVPTPVPGLVVNEDPVTSGFWNVTHVASGAAVACLPEPEAALDAAISLRGLADWTRSGEDLQADKAAEAAFGTWREGPGRYHTPGAWKWYPGAPGKGAAGELAS